MANAEHLRIFREGAEAWNKWREMNPNIVPDLSEGNFIQKDLRGYNFRGVNFKDANFRGANLEGVDLSESNLQGADFSEFHTYVESTGSFSDKYIFGMTRRETRVSKKTNLRKVNLRGAILTDVVLKDAYLDGMVIDDNVLSFIGLSTEDLINSHIKLMRGNVEINYNPPLVQLQFDGIFPSPFHTETWQDLLVYVYFENAVQKVLQDFEKRKQTLTGAYAGTSTSSQNQIPPDSILTIVPNISAVTCNPPSLQFRITEDYHCLQFRVRHEATDLVKKIGRGNITGTINIYLENLLIGEIPVHSNWEIPGAAPVVNSILVNSITSRSAGTSASKNELKRETSRQFQKIFVSYSSKDSAIVARLEKAYTALGHEYWRDIKKLRSGESWSPAIQAAINDSDIFQLCWSNNSKTSTYVEQEWRAALARDLPEFIRPVYWEKPIPTRPRELSHLHFAEYPLDDK